MDMHQLLETVTDLFTKRDFGSLAIVVGLALGSYLALTLVNKVAIPAVKGTAKLGWRGAKWAVTSQPPSELAQTLLAKLERTDGYMLNATDIQVGEVVFWCPANSTKFTEVRVGSGQDNRDVTTLLSRKDRRRVIRAAYKTRTQIQERDAKANVDKYLAVLKPAECSPPKEAKYCTTAAGAGVPSLGKAASTSNTAGRAFIEVQSAAPVNCPCPDCTDLRNKRGA